MSESLAEARPLRRQGGMPRVGFLWKYPSTGLYANVPFDHLFTASGHNTGNLAFVHAIASQIRNPVTFLGWSSPAELLRREADLLVIPCANQLGGHTNYGAMAENLEKSGLPIVAIGLGAQAASYDEDVAPTEGTLRWVRAIAAARGGQGANIYTRGPYTTGQLEKLGIGDVLSGGCPSCFLNTAADLGQQIHAHWSQAGLPRALSVAAGHQAWMATREVEHQLITLMMDPIAPGQYVVQSMAEMLKMARGIFEGMSEHALRGLHNHTVPHYSFEEFKAWSRSYARAYFDVPAWMDSLRRHDLAVGTRYHGVALALQVGRMGLTIAIDSRTRELCENTGVPFIELGQISGPLTRASLRRMVRFDPGAYDAQRRVAAGRYVEFLHDNGLEPASDLAKLAG
ncbi:polysaccharide pyruvyl transferase family protein [Roseomonas sp. GC11]|uniref:polysaccharide pyruvyl transferase family protein n=1 Tax=Roseomonas sp. GC11 TaxID=2950546 RepID=UPI00210C6659|nr:polysaccharide pyruvyl transferase family protein [Roseomonas sp. GC11]MCQ4161277.1 polysaccharide pyruvyl transferase family protein [Roseomonas sp. GC11]